MNEAEKRQYLIASCWRLMRTAMAGLALLLMLCVSARLSAAEKPPVDLSQLPPSVDRTVDFVKDIRPIFELNCYKCHGPDKQKSEYRLDSKVVALKGGEHGQDIIPGKSAESPLIHFVAGLAKDMQMPAKGERLTVEQIGLLRAWIDQGALWPDEADTKLPSKLDWWSLKPLRRPALPKIKEADVEWVRNPIDAFVLAKLLEKGLAPSPEADRVTLVRRLHIDLTGLPPTPDEIASFVHDKAPDAYNHLVEKLLASTRYGERWARHWLDVVHYGDTHGYDKDQPRPYAWPYRDYVIRAFNEDKPYTRFVEEQLAGDVLFPDTVDGIVGTGFISAGPWDLIGHAEVPEEKIDGKIARLLDRDDMVSNTMNTFNSLTVQCARCHNHKFDPVTQEDYYSLQAVFAALDRANKNFDVDPQVRKKRAEPEARKKSLTEKKKALEEQIKKLGGDELATVEKQIQEAKKAAKASEGEAFGYHSEIVASQDTTKWVQVDLGKSVLVEKVVYVAAHDDFNNIGDGFGFPPRFKVEISDDERFQSGVSVISDYTKTDFSNPGVVPQNIVVHGKKARYVRMTATKLAPRQNDYIFALGEVSVADAEGKNLALGGTVTALDSIEAPPRWQKKNLVDGFYYGVNQDKTNSEELAKLEDKRKLILDKVDASVKAELAAVAQSLGTVEKVIADLPKPSAVYAGTAYSGSGAFMGTAGKPRVIQVLHRGDVQKPGATVSPGTVPLFDGVESAFTWTENQPEGERRIALAKWITDPRNSLTWRSIVNRVWLYHFGRGIVDSPNDFGRMGQLPTHPELLDWLAVEFRDGGQSIKELHRLIVTSSTYRQSSVGNPNFEKIDADNRYLWRMHRRRLEAEAIRDTVLALAGKLNEEMYGPGFQDFVVEKPEHSPHYQYHLYDPDDPKSHRRSVYRFLVRSQQSPFMTTLDCADPSQMVDKRNETLTPLQALALLNDKFMVTMSRHFAARVEKMSEQPAAQVEMAFRLAIGRSPTLEERPSLIAYESQHGLASACRLIFNLNEFVFID